MSLLILIVPSAGNNLGWVLVQDESEALNRAVQRLSPAVSQEALSFLLLSHARELEPLSVGGSRHQTFCRSLHSLISSISFATSEGPSV